MTSAIGFEPSAEAVRAVGTWLDQLVTWNAKHDLTAARTHDELVDLLLADAAFFAARLPAGARVVDVGTGAGAPGLGLALLRPDLRVTLIEPLTKRIAFLRGTLAAVKRLDVRLERARGEQHVVPPDAEARFDVAMARATLPPDAWLELGLDLVAGRRGTEGASTTAAPSNPAAGASGPKGASAASPAVVWVLLAQKDPPRSPRARLLEEVRYTWPRTGQERRALAFAPATP